MAKTFINIDVNKLKQQYENGMSLRKLAKLYNTSKVTIKRKLLKTGVKILTSKETVCQNIEKHKRSSTPNATDHELIVKLASTSTIAEISRKTGNNSHTISRILSQYNIKPIKFNPSAYMSQLGEDTKQDWDTKDNLYNLYVINKMSCTDIAKKYDCDKETIRTKLINHSITRRSISESGKIIANTDRNKQIRSAITKQLWTDDKYRQTIISKLSGSRPKMPTGHGKNVSTALKKLYKDEQFLQRHRDKIKKLWQSPTKAMLQHLYYLHKNLREDSEIREKHLKKMNLESRKEQLSHSALSDIIFLKYQLPIIRRKCSQAAKKAWQNPEYRDKILQAISNRASSKLEIIIHSILNDLHLQHNKVRLGKKQFEFDVCIEKGQLKQNRGLLLEINGLYAHSLPKQIQRDADRQLFWKEKLSSTYRYETIWEYDFGAYKQLYTKLLSILQINQPAINISLSDLNIIKIKSEDAELFYNKYHYLSNHRYGYHIGAHLGGNLIACGTISAITRQQSAQKQNLDYTELKQLSRFCISPLYHNKNLASFLLSKIIKLYSKDKPQVKKLITFADQDVNHHGTIYKASNWKLDGITKSSYIYQKQGFTWHKKTIWDYSRSMGLTESEFIALFDIAKIDTKPKYRYVYDLTS